MADLKFVFVFACVFALAGLFQVEAASRAEREVQEGTAPENTQLEKVQQQLTTAFDSLKKSMEELTSKFNAEDIVQGVQNLTSKLENYIKQTADQFASSASGAAGTENKKPEGEQQQPQQPQP